MKADDEKHMQTALDLARKGYGRTSPNPLVGALLVKGRAVIGKGWHRRAGGPHAEVEAIRDAERHDYNVKGATLCDAGTCCTTGRTPPCTDAIQGQELNVWWWVPLIRIPNTLDAHFAYCAKRGLKCDIRYFSGRRRQ